MDGKKILVLEFGMKKEDEMKFTAQAKNVCAVSIYRKT